MRNKQRRDEVKFEKVSIMNQIQLCRPSISSIIRSKILRHVFHNFLEKRLSHRKLKTFSNIFFLTIDMYYVRKYGVNLIEYCSGFHRTFSNNFFVGKLKNFFSVFHMICQFVRSFLHFYVSDDGENGCGKWKKFLSHLKRFLNIINNILEVCYVLQMIDLFQWIDLFSCGRLFEKNDDSNFHIMSLMKWRNLKTSKFFSILVYLMLLFEKVISSFDDVNDGSERSGNDVDLLGNLFGDNIDRSNRSKSTKREIDSMNCHEQFEERLKKVKCDRLILCEKCRRIMRRNETEQFYDHHTNILHFDKSCSFGSEHLKNVIKWNIFTPIIHDDWTFNRKE
ncbi:hypothetical protein SNEBB_010908 [Seison nebaliae]|nr:hypothetical protein SNEBB_010908 [Seison nebaliae]